MRRIVIHKHDGLPKVDVFPFFSPCHCASGLSSLKGFPALIGAKINDAMTLPGEATLPRKDS